MQEKLYDTVKKILEKYPVTRSDDKKLIWTVFGTLGYIENKRMSRDDFFSSPSCESITRARRKIQELHPELDASKFVKKARSHIESKKGTHIFRERVAYKGVGKQAEIDDIVSL